MVIEETKGQLQMGTAEIEIRQGCGLPIPPNLTGKVRSDHKASPSASQSKSAGKLVLIFCSRGARDDEISGRVEARYVQRPAKPWVKAV